MKTWTKEKHLSHYLGKPGEVLWGRLQRITSGGYIIWSEPAPKLPTPNALRREPVEA
jgi:hypothetical protein